MRYLFTYAFRPFFLLNSLFAIVALAIWVTALHGAGPPSLPVNVMGWHGHEMLVGFTLAAIAGFSLTAVATWTGRPPVHGRELATLVACWLVGRVAMGLGGVLPAALVAALDMLFPLFLVWLIGREIIGAGNNRNYPVVLVIAMLAILNGFYHLAALGIAPMHVGIDRSALQLFVHVALLLITIIGGRIVPNFTANWLRKNGSRQMPVSTPGIELLCIGSTILTGLFAAFAPLSGATGGLAAAAAVLHGVRLSRWCGHLTRAEPLLLILHLAYLWLPVGYALTATAVFGWLITPAVALHALTMGAIGTMVLAVMSRVALGHTGRPLRAPGSIVIAYWVLIAATGVRLFGDSAQHYLTLVGVSAAGWMFAFAIFAWVYWPVLTGPRIDQNGS
jgi:uncharacterized protein involved in response to NO